MAGYSAPALKIRPIGGMLPCMAAARFAAVLLFVLSTILCAQDRPTSRLVVTILDTSGAVVPGARIGIISLPSITQEESDLLQSALHSPEQVSTNANGAGEAAVDLTNGRYAVIVTASGFERYLEKLAVRDEPNRSVRIVLKINPENVRGDCMACTQVIPVEPMVLNAPIPLEPIQSITLKPVRTRYR